MTSCWLTRWRRETSQPGRNLSRGRAWPFCPAKSHLVSLGPGNLSRGRFPGALLVALLCFSSAPAPVLAASFTVPAARDASNPDTVPKVLDKKGETGKVEENAVLKPARRIPITISHVVTVDIAGTVATTGFQQIAVKARNTNAEAGAKLILRATGTISTTGMSGHAVGNDRADFTFDMEGGSITTTGIVTYAVYSNARAANFTFTMADGTISTQGSGAHAVFSEGANFQFTMQGGSITTTNNISYAVYSRGEKFQFKMQGGSITTNGDGSSAIYLYPEGNLDAKSGQGFEHLLEIGAAATATTKGEEAHVIFIDDNPGTSRTRIDIAGTVTAEGKDAVAVLIEDADVTEFVISGTVKAAKKKAKVAIKTDKDAPLRLDIKGTGKVIGDIVLTGAVDSITLAGSIEGDIDFGGGNDIFTLDGGTITGNIDMGEGVDTLTLNGGAIINGNIDMGGGNDTLTINGAAGRIKGASSRAGDKEGVVIKMGAGDDIVKLKGIENLPYGMIDGGEGGTDTIELRGLLEALTEGRKTSYRFAWKNFEKEQGIVEKVIEEEVEEKNPDPPKPPVKEAEEKAVAPDEKEGGEEEEEVEKEAEENAGAPDEKVDKPDPPKPPVKEAEENAGAPDEKVDKPDPPKPPVKEAEEKAVAPDEKVDKPDPPKPSGKEGGEEEVENAGGASGNGNGGGQALASGPSGQQFDQRELDKYGPYLIGINLPGQAGYDPNKEKIVYAFNPSGQAVEAQALVGLTDALHDLGARRLGRGGSSARRAARPLRVASSERIPGLLFRDRRPSVWGEAFGLYQRRAQDGFASGYAMNQKGVALGVEQGFRGERARLGLLVGYARAALRTRPWDIRTDSDSFFAGVYGRQRLDGLDESLYVQGSLNVSLSKHDNRRRTMNHDARGKYSSWGVSPSLTVGRVFRLETVLPGGELSLEPSVDLRYSAGFYDDYRETGEPGLVMTIKERVQQSLSGRLNLAGIYDLPDGGGSVSLRLGLSHRRLFASDLEGSFSDRAFKFKSAASNNVTLGHAGVDIAVNLAEGLSLNGRYEYSHSIGTVSDRTNSGQLSLVYRF